MRSEEEIREELNDLREQLKQEKNLFTKGEINLAIMWLEWVLHEEGGE